MRRLLLPRKRADFLVLAWVLLACTASAAAEPTIDFNRDVRSILSENCFVCHGPDDKHREADLRLDIRDGALGKTGGPAAVVPGQPEKSELIARLVSDDEDVRMPPAETGKKLSTRQVDLLRRWIAAGANYEKHWSFVAPTRSPLPEVIDTDWGHNAIDRFVLARLEQAGLRGSRAAERATLIRRLYLDLLGLLPSPDEVDDFAGDKRPDAYARLVDRLLANPHFGERWGRHWLDQARYADSNGYAPDGARTMWPYRDWVISAFNDDMPFDQFTIEQLAGDLLDDPTTAQLVATGFHRNTLINTEGGTKADQFRVEQTKDRVDTTGAVWMALTIGCANCHTHKYDPIAQREYYQLYAFFDSLQDRNSVSPTVKVPSPLQTKQVAALDKQIATVRAQIDADDPDRAERRAQWEVSLTHSAPRSAPSWRVLELAGESRHEATLTRLPDNSLLVGGANRAGDHYTLRGAAPIETIRSLRLELIKHQSLPMGGPGRAGNGNLVLSQLQVISPDGKPCRFSRAWADHSQPKYAIAGAIDENQKTGWAINGSPEGGANQKRVAELTLASPLTVKPGESLTIVMQFHNGALVYNLGRFRVSVAAEASTRQEDKSKIKVATIPPEKRLPAQQKKLDEAFARDDVKLGPLTAELKQLEDRRKALDKSLPTAMILRELTRLRETYIQIRGDFLRKGEVVTADVPDVLPALRHFAEEKPARATRLEFARWLVRDDHPLTSRVRVNRIWMRLFGRGLVETENDFGAQGAMPSHPELLDWLSREFIEQGWSTKRLIRLIVLSQTYCQASHVRPDLQAADPRNVFLGRQNRVRVEAEIVRDLALSAAGLLSEKIGGPSVFPPQPDGVYSFTQVKKSWKTSPGEDRYRRGMYTFFYRSAPHPMLSTFDVPRFNQTCTQRSRSNTPLQSLTMANDEAMVEAARGLALRVLREKNPEPIRRMFRICLSLAPNQAEYAALAAFQSKEHAYFREHPDEAKALAGTALPEDVSPGKAAAWTAIARVLLNLDEMITRE